jgi:hypothetical protein
MIDVACFDDLVPAHLIYRVREFVTTAQASNGRRFEVLEVFALLAMLFWDTRLAVLQIVCYVVPYTV